MTSRGLFALAALATTFLDGCAIHELLRSKGAPEPNRVYYPHREVDVPTVQFPAPTERSAEEQSRARIEEAERAAAEREQAAAERKRARAEDERAEADRRVRRDFELRRAQRRHEAPGANVGAGAPVVPIDPRRK